jgi:hypothetical protein
MNKEIIINVKKRQKEERQRKCEVNMVKLIFTKSAKIKKRRNVPRRENISISWGENEKI